MKSLLTFRNGATAAAIGRFGALLLLAATVLPAAMGSAASPDRKRIGKTIAGPGTVVGTLGAAACVPGSVSCDATVTGQLTTDDCRLPSDQSFYDAWTVSLTAGQTVQITMQSTAFDTYLFLIDPSGIELEDNDDYPGGGSNSRITYTAETTGVFTIYANAYDPGATGAYSLQVLCSQGPGTCVGGPTTLCLNNGRFRATAIFTAPSLGITNGAAQAVSLTSDTGYFWFFSANNVEIVLKVVDGRAFNNFFWVFFGALSDVQYTITVTDTQTGAVRNYSNPQGRLASVADVTAFPGGAAKVESTPAMTGGELEEVAAAETQALARLLSASAPLACQADPTTLCVNGARFQVRVDWSVPSQGTSGAGRAVSLTSDTGYFWFFSANNVELVIKVVDGRAFNNFFWVFYGALSDVAYTITVTDTVTGNVKVYTNPQGRLASVADVTAF
ncbi:MAG TPA: PPC domain-containing protein [Thermoanaerobaculia bacterium]|nr:PPC domain-containing protein [Thermoanaerobaculia bacterium]